MIIDRDAIRSLLPHQGAMCLIDSVQRFDQASIACTTSQHLRADNPLRRERRLSAMHAIEFAAQAAALHAALNLPSPASPRAGLLVSVRNCVLHAATLDAGSGAMVIEALLSAQAAMFATYDFVVSSQGARLAAGRLGVYTEAAQR